MQAYRNTMNLTFRPLTALLFFLVTPVSLVLAQSPLDVGIHLTPQVRYVNSRPAEVRQTNIPTTGGDGLAVGMGGGAYLEYEFAPGWSARAGIDFSYKRNHYTVSRTFTETDSTVAGHNRIAYASIEVPVSVVYHFDYRRHDNRFLVGVGTTLNRWNGAPIFRTRFGKGSASEPVVTAKHSVTLFAGYEHPVSDMLVMSYEPYVAYVPTRFNLETASRARVFAEVGLAVRLRLDN